MSDVLTAIANNAAGICQVGRDVCFEGHDDAPCAEYATNLVNVSTDAEVLRFSMCGGHRAALGTLERADQLILLELAPEVQP